MTFEIFQKTFPEYEDITVIGKNIEREGKPYHLIGMTRCGDTAQLYILNTCRPLDSYSVDEGRQEWTRRERMKNQEEADENYFMGIEALLIDGKEYSVCSASSGCMNPWSDLEEMVLFIEMKKAGWCLPEKSVFYRRDWEEIGLTKLTIPLEDKKLPMWENKEIIIVRCTKTQNFLLEKPVTLPIRDEEEKPESASAGDETGQPESASAGDETKQPESASAESGMEISFVKEDGTQAVCYINKVYLMDVWKDQEERFADPTWKDKMKMYMSETEIDELKQTTEKALEQDCPRGMYYVGIEYECSDNMGLQFYSREYLDSVPSVHEESATSMLMLLKPEEKTGMHGLKLRGAVIQTPVAGGTKEIEAELFYYMVTIPQQKEKMT